MNTFLHNFFQSDVIMAMYFVIATIIIGLFLSKKKVFGISLGLTYVFIVGIILSNYIHFENKGLLTVLQSFGLILFLYALGLQIGVGFFESFKREGLKFNILSASIIFTSICVAIFGGKFLFGIEIIDTIGVFAGATANIPVLGASKQMEYMNIFNGNNLAIACAVTYPIGLLLPVFIIKVLRKLKHINRTHNKYRRVKDHEFVVISCFKIENPNIFNSTVVNIADKNHDIHFVITRIWRDNTLIIPKVDTLIHEGDLVVVTSAKKCIPKLEILLGKKDKKDWNDKSIDWDSLDDSLFSKIIVITNEFINGKTIAELRLRNNYQINITRIYRADKEIFATPTLRLNIGDKLTIIGTKECVTKASSFLGNASGKLKETNLLSLLTGLLIGLTVAACPIYLPWFEKPLTIGIAAGPLSVGLLIGAFGSRVKLITYTPQSVNYLLRQLGLAMFLSGLGLSVGQHFFEVLISLLALKWIALAIAINVIPIVMVGIFMLYYKKIAYYSALGVICGAMANSIALMKAMGSTDKNENKSHILLAYTVVFPLGILLRVILAQIFIIIFYT